MTNLLQIPLRRRQKRISASASLRELVVVGNGPVGYALCKKLVELQATSRFQVTVFGEEPRPAYDRVNLTRALKLESADQLEYAPRKWYEDHQIRLITGDPIIEIDRGQQRVRSAGGEQVPFDELVLCTGSRPFVPPIAGVDLPGVFVYRTWDDLLQIRQFSQKSKSAVVLGGGLLGLEAAQALLDLGLQVTVLEVAAALMPRQLDTAAAELLLKNVEQRGIAVRLLARTRQIRELNHSLQVVLDSGDDISCDLVVISAGIRPRDELAQQAGLEIGSRGGIVVNDDLQTSAANIHAIGECVLHRGMIYGLITPGKQMANVLAARLMGQRTCFVTGDTSTTLKLAGTHVSTVGDFLEDGPQYEHLPKQQGNCYRKLILRRGRFAGAVVVGEDPEFPRLKEAIFHQRRLWNWQRQRYMKSGRIWSEKNTLNVADWPANSIICSCNRVSKQTIVEAERSGCTTVAEICQATAAGTSCGSCKVLLAQMLGDNTRQEVPRGSVPLLLSSMLAMIVLLLILLMPPVASAESVQSNWYEIEWWYRESLPKQITGFTMLGLLMLGMTHTLRKRWGRFRWGNYGYWRAFHGGMGLMSLLLLITHTGFQHGQNFNALLMYSFCLLSALGAVAGIISALESWLTGSVARLIKTYRPWIVQLHIWLCWPLPVLVGFHVLSVYYFGK